MTRTGLLRAGYAGLGITFLALAATFSPAGGALLGFGLLVGFAGAVLLAFSGDELPRMAGLAIVGYFLLCFIAFVGANGATINIGGTRWFVNDQPSPLFRAVFDLLVIGLPFLFAGAAGVAVWEAGAPRWLVIGAGAGFVLLALATVVSSPQEVSVQTAGENTALAGLFAVAALAGAAGAFWASARPDG